MINPLHAEHYVLAEADVEEMFGVSGEQLEIWTATLGFPHARELAPGTDLYVYDADAVLGWWSDRAVMEFTRLSQIDSL